MNDRVRWHTTLLLRAVSFIVFRLCDDCCVFCENTPIILYYSEIIYLLIPILFFILIPLQIEGRWIESNLRIKCVFIYTLHKNIVILFSRTENTPDDKMSSKIVGGKVANKQGNASNTSIEPDIQYMGLIWNLTILWIYF